jgi:hypothetical protein
MHIPTNFFLCGLELVRCLVPKKADEYIFIKMKCNKRQIILLVSTKIYTIELATTYKNQDEEIEAVILNSDITQLLSFFSFVIEPVVTLSLLKREEIDQLSISCDLGTIFIPLHDTCFSSVPIKVLSTKKDKKLSAEIIEKIINGTSFISLKDILYRPELEIIYLQQKGDKLYVRKTDGHRLIELRLTNKKSHSDSVQYFHSALIPAIKFLQKRGASIFSFVSTEEHEQTIITVSSCIDDLSVAISICTVIGRFAVRDRIEQLLQKESLSLFQINHKILLSACQKFFRNFKEITIQYNSKRDFIVLSGGQENKYAKIMLPVTNLCPIQYKYEKTLDTKYVVQFLSRYKGKNIYFSTHCEEEYSIFYGDYQTYIIAHRRRIEK